MTLETSLPGFCYFTKSHNNFFTDLMASTRGGEGGWNGVQRKSGNAKEESNNCLKHVSLQSIPCLQWFLILVGFGLF